MPSVDDLPPPSPSADLSLADERHSLAAASSPPDPSPLEAPAEDKDGDEDGDENEHEDENENENETENENENDGYADADELEDEVEASMEAEEGFPVGGGTLEDAQRLYDEGRDALLHDFDRAAELFSRCLEIRALHYGELAIECASTYYKYGCALLYKAQSESDPLGEVNEVSEPSAAPGRPGKPIKDEATEEDLEEEEESDLDMAWKMLDIARVIYEKQQSHSIEEVDVITALADVSLEREDFEMCFQDYMKALEIMEGLVESDHRGIAEIYFKLSLAHQLGYKPREALKYCQQAVRVCETRLKRLRNQAAVSNGTVDIKGKSIIEEENGKQSQKSLGEVKVETAPTETGSETSKEEDEIKEIEQLLEDLREKVLELEGMASGPSLLESLNETNPGAVDSIKQVFSATAQFVSLPGQTSSFDTPSGSASTTAEVTDLGIVGRGVKRSAPTSVSSAINGQGNKENTPKKRSLDDMLTKGASGEVNSCLEENARRYTSDTCPTKICPSPTCHCLEDGK